MKYMKYFVFYLSTELCYDCVEILLLNQGNHAVNNFILVELLCIVVVQFSDSCNVVLMKLSKSCCRCIVDIVVMYIVVRYL